MNKNNDDFMDNILKEKSLKEDVIVPDNINNIIKLTVSNLPDKSRISRKGENIFSNIYKLLSKIEFASIIELALIIIALILVPTIINNHNKSYNEKRVAENASPVSSVKVPENSKQSSSSIVNNTFDENKAISMVIKDHGDFPANQSESITKEVPIGGGPASSTLKAKVKFTTKVEKTSESAYVVTLIKDWNFTFSGKPVISSWKYNVTPGSITLLESNDNDYLMQTIK